MLFRLALIKFFKSELFSSLRKVGHVIKSCKEPITLVTSDDSDVSAMLTLQRIAFRNETKRYPYYAHLSDVDCPLWKSAWKSLRYRNRAEIPVLRDRSFVTFPGGGAGGGGEILKLNAQNVRGGGRNIKTQGWPSMGKSCQIVLALFK